MKLKKLINAPVTSILHPTGTTYLSNNIKKIIQNNMHFIRTEMNLNQFITGFTGQAICYDGVLADTGQCVQLVAEYCVRVLGFTPPMKNAVDWWTDDSVNAAFTKIPIGQEQPGDIAIWGASNVINSPLYGHIDIVVAPGFTGFDSNWGGVNNAAGYPIAHQVSHNYTDVLGFLRYNGGNMVPINNGDVVNVYQSLLNRQPDQEALNYWINSTDWKDFIYSIINSDEFKLDHFINSGDVVNMKAKGIDISQVVGQDWKAGNYNDATKGIAPDAVVLQPGLYEVQ